MFRNPFSFNGRIRRLEYGLTWLVAAFPLAVLNAVMDNNTTEMTPIWFFVYILLLWLFLAQGAKRCHDRGKSGWWQLLPFYGLLLLFKDGDPYNNNYGADPKKREVIEEGKQDLLPDEA